VNITYPIKRNHMILSLEFVIFVQFSSYSMLNLHSAFKARITSVDVCTSRMKLMRSLDSQSVTKDYYIKMVRHYSNSTICIWAYKSTFRNSKFKAMARLTPSPEETNTY